MAQIFHHDDHDTVVRKYAELIMKNNPGQFKVTTNLDDSESVEVGGISPDIVLHDSSGNDLLTVIEVETAASVGSEQAEARWKPISEGAPVLQIIVPKGTQARARRICKKLGIKARFQEY